ncbi:MAG TPA: circadian clock protein KaiC, partial [Vicinamibacterales bacterium]|nr:circadian clock protein KaiC [Vicinamibacterales bacterium]
GGLPQGRATLLSGGPGTGKTVFALASLVHGAKALGEPGLFVTFEEDSRRIIANASTFGWGLPDLVRRGRIGFHDARLPRAVIRDGAFDLQGLLAGIGLLVDRHRARRLVLDGLDVLLGTLGDAELERRELFGLHEWLAGSGLTAILTAKTEGFLDGAAPFYPYLPYLADCVILFRMAVDERMARRCLRVLKYRGVEHSSNEFPLVISASGVEVASYGPGVRDYRAPRETIGSGIPRLDRMLGGGFYRGSSVLVSGAPGTAKTTLAAAFLLEACRRGERALFVSLDEAPAQIVRNMAAVGLDLQPHLATGRLRMYSIRPRADSPDYHLVRICRAIVEHGARALVLDPISALGGARTTDSTDPAKRLLDFAKERGVSVLATTLLAGPDASEEATAADISTMADTWIHLSYVVRSGERNRALTIVKSRGLGHSNQVRELVLSSRGVTLSDVYAAGGEVLMGTLRWEKEEAERLARLRREARAARRRHRLQLALERQRAQMAALQTEMRASAAELQRLAAERAAERRLERLRTAGLRSLRGADRDVETDEDREAPAARRQAAGTSRRGRRAPRGRKARR